jgi:hypothetical protein
MPLLDRKSPPLLFTLATIGIGVSETQAAGPRDYEGPQGWSQDGPAVIEPPSAAPPSTPPPVGEAPAEGDFPVEDTTTPAPPPTPAEPAAPPPEDDSGCADGDFCVEDLTTDEEALKKEMAPKAAPKLAGPAGTLSGRMLDATSGSPLIGVNVIVVGTDHKTKTDIDGRYTLTVPPGTYQVRIWYDAYEGMTISGVVVENDKAVTVNREIKPIAGMTQTVAVTAEINKESAAGKLVERKKSVAARDMMSRDDIRKSGGGATSAAARRIVGSTLVGGRFLFVRGLGHRYGNTLLDGARLPSPDPNLRSVPLDIFPSGALSAINVQKTATPDVPADFAGASVQLESREIPERFTWSLWANLGVNTATTGRQRATGDRFFGDGVGFGNLARGLPGSFNQPHPIDSIYKPTGSLENFYSPKQIEQFGESMPSTRTAISDTTKALPNANFQGTVGNTFRPWGTELGVFAAVNYNNQRQTLREKVGIFANSGGQVATEDARVDYEGLKTTDNVQLSGLGALRWKFNKHNRLSFSTFYTRDADREARLLSGFVQSTTDTIPVLNTRLRYQMRSVAVHPPRRQARDPPRQGLHDRMVRLVRPGPPGRPAAARDAVPQQRRRQLQPSTNRVRQVPVLQADRHAGSGGLDFTAPSSSGGSSTRASSSAAWAEAKRRTFGTAPSTSSRANMATPRRAPATSSTTTPSAAATRPGRHRALRDQRVHPPGQGRLRRQPGVYAGYAMLDLPLVRWLRLVGGARFEANDIRVSPFDIFGRRSTRTPREGQEPQRPPVGEPDLRAART